MSADQAPQGFQRDVQQLALPVDFLERLAGSTLDRAGILVVLNLFALLGSEQNVAVESMVLAEAGEMLLGGKEAYQHGLDQALEAGFILSFADGQSQQVYWLPGTPKGRNLLAKLQLGEESLAGEKIVARLPLEQRPNIYKLYEANIGPLTPMMAEMLREDAEQYPYDWIEDAVAEAVERNKRSWRYVRAILSAWKERGRDTTKQEGSIVEEYRRLYQEQRKRRGGKTS